MGHPESWSLEVAVAVFLAAATTIVFVGRHLTSTSEALSRRTGLGEAIFGALFLGGATSISGLTTSITAAATNHPELALSNALGGIAAQTAFLAVADMTFRGANLEHAAASMSNLVQGALCSTLLAIILFGMIGPQWTLFGIHPASVVVFLFYLFGLKLVSSARTDPMWKPLRTQETRGDGDEATDERSGASTVSLWSQFGGSALVVALAGFFIARSGVAISLHTGLSETLVGALFTAISTSLPELVTAIAAVRQGALTLAVAGVIGGNSFDALFVTLSDIAYRRGSIYGEANDGQLLLVVLSILLTNVLLLGLLRREKYGVAGIGFESFLVLIGYLGFLLLLFL